MKIKNLIVTIVLLFIVCTFGCENTLEPVEDISIQSSEQNRGVNARFVILYEHSNYKGRSIKINKRSGVINLSELNNKVSSLKVFACDVRFYDGRNKTGLYSDTFGQYVPDLLTYGYNDLASSMVFADLANDTNYVELYTEPNFKGKKYHFKLNEYSPSLNLNGTFNNKVSSVKVVGDVSITLYDYSNCSGSFTVVNSKGIKNLSSINFNNKVSSITYASPTVPYVIIYDGHNYDGASYVISRDISNLGAINFDNRISSVQVFGTKSVLFYKDKRYNFHYPSYLKNKGKKFVDYRPIRGNVRLGSYGFNNKISSIDL